VSTFSEEGHTSCAARLRIPRREWALSHLCGLARQACFTIGNEQPMSKANLLR